MTLSKKLKQRKEDLKKRIEEAISKLYENIYDDLMEYFKIEKEENPDKSITEICMDLGISHAYYYTIRSWGERSKHVENLVADGKITMSKACRILYKYKTENKKNLDMMFDEIIKKKLSYPEMHKLFKKNNEKNFKEQMKSVKSYSRNCHILRDIKTHCNKLKYILKNLNNIPKSSRIETKNQLWSLNKKLEECIDKLN